jgi:hypothetical protein
MTAIAFVGDSFCSAYSLSECKSCQHTYSQKGTNEPVWPSIVTKTNHYTLYPYGFGGKSWWYSRQRFVEDLERIPKNIFADNLEVIVFVIQILVVSIIPGTESYLIQTLPPPKPKIIIVIFLTANLINGHSSNGLKKSMIGGDI